jgi:hypothetical protein
MCLLYSALANYCIKVILKLWSVSISRPRLPHFFPRCWATRLEFVIALGPPHQTRAARESPRRPRAWKSCADKGRMSTLVSGIQGSQFYEFNQHKTGSLRSCTNRWTWNTPNASDLCTGRRWPRTWAKLRLFAVPPRSKSVAWGWKKRVSWGWGHRWNKARRRHWILICAAPQ